MSKFKDDAVKQSSPRLQAKSDGNVWATVKVIVGTSDIETYLSGPRNIAENRRKKTSCAGGRRNMPPPPASCQCLRTYSPGGTCSGMLAIWDISNKFTLDFEIGVRVTCDVGYLCTNFSLPRPICSRVRPNVRDRRQTDVRQTDVRQKHCLMPPTALRGRRHKNALAGIEQYWHWYHTECRRKSLKDAYRFQATTTTMATAADASALLMTTAVIITVHQQRSHASVLLYAITSNKLLSNANEVMFSSAFVCLFVCLLEGLCKN